MNRSVIVLGAGGHAKVLINALRCANVDIVGIADVVANATGISLMGVPIIGDDEAVLRNHKPEDVYLVNGLGSTGKTENRSALYEKFKGHGYRFATVVHPSTVIGIDVELCEGCQIMAGAVIQPGCRVGCNAIVNTRSSVDHDCKIGDHVHVAPGVTLSGGVWLGSGAHVGTGATVIQDVRVGEGSIIGAGAVVINNVPSRQMVVGIPARRVLR